MRCTDLVIRALLLGLLTTFVACATPGTGGPEGAKQAMDGARAAPSQHLASTSAATPPAVKPLTVRFDQAPVMGDPHAKVAIIEFGDFECRFCRRYHRSTFQQIKHEYMDHGRVQYLFRDFPLPIHRHARGAAIAAHCAGEQGAYWAMLHEIFDSNERLGPDLYRKYAKFFRLNTKRFDRCLTDGSQAAKVDQNVSYGRSLKIDGTPAFFIGTVKGDHITNVKRLSGALPLKVFEKAVDTALLEAGGQG